jgi:hypothetical protein
MNLKRVVGVLIFLAGVVLTVALGALATWGDLEASLFDAAIRAETRLNSLRCPVLITRQETGQVSASFRNTSPRPVNRAIRAHISQGFVTLMREETLYLPLQPGETQRLTWPVTAADAAYGALILVRVSALRQAPMPSESQACGIVVLDLPWVSGGLLVAVWLALGLAGIAGGGWLWLRVNWPWVGRRHAATNTMLAVTVVALALLVAGLAGVWMLGVLLLALLALLLIAIMTHLLLEV